MAGGAIERQVGRRTLVGSTDANLIFTLTDRGRLALVWDAGTNDYQQITTDQTDCVPSSQVITHSIFAL